GARRRTAGGEGNDARIRREEPAQGTMHDRRSEIERERPKSRLRLRLEAVQMGRVRVVQLKAEYRQRGIAHGDLKIPVDVVEAIDLRAQMAIETRCLPTELVIRQFFGPERPGRTQ